MQRRKFLIGAGSLAAGGAAVMGSGAFTQVSAERHVNVRVADDSNAFLTLDPTVGQNSEFASESGSGEVVVNIDDNGINQDATTILLEVFRIKNDGTDPAIVYVNPDSVTIDGTQVSSGNTDDYIDPQASNLPNGSGAFTGLPPIGYDALSMTAVYLAGQSDGNPQTDPPAFKQAADNLVFNSGNGAGEFKLNVGQSFDFGLFIKESRTDGNAGFGDVSMELVADTNIA